MSVVKKTIYCCDPCGAEVPAGSDLKRIYVQWGRRRSYGEDRPGIKADFCYDCFQKFSDEIAVFFGEAGRATLTGTTTTTPVEE